MKIFIFILLSSFLFIASCEDFSEYCGALTEVNWIFPINNRGDSGLVSEFPLGTINKVMRLRGSENTRLCNRIPLMMPLNGQMVFSIWARAAEGSGELTFAINGDREKGREIYHWRNNRTVTLTEEYRKFEIRCTLPETVKNSRIFQLRFLVRPGSDILIGRTELKHIAVKARTGARHNLIENSEFLFDDFFWEISRTTPQMSEESLRWPHSKIANGRALLHPGTVLHSLSFAYRPKTDYTVKLRMKGKGSKVLAALITGEFKSTKETFALTNDWQDYTFTGQIPESRGLRSYLRIILQNNSSAEINRVQITEGKDVSWLEVPVHLGFTGGNYFDWQAPAALSMRVIMPHERKRELKVTMTVCDAFGDIVQRKELSFSASPDQTREIPVDTGKRGLFTVKLSAESEEFSYRYTVMKNLENVVLPENPFAIQLNPLFQPLPESYKRYLPIRGSFNRFFEKNSEQIVNGASRSKNYNFSTPHAGRALDASREYGGLVILCLNDRKVRWSEFTPELLDEYRCELEEKITSYKGKIDGVELSNEPSLARYLTGPDKGKHSLTPEKLFTLYEIASPIIRRIAPEMLILGPCANGTDMISYTERFFEQGGINYIDVLSFHPYSSDPDTFDMAGKINALHGLRRKYGKPEMPVWNTEQYYGLRSAPFRFTDKEAFRSYFRDTEIDHAAVMSSNLVQHALHGTKFCVFIPKFSLGLADGKAGYLLAAAPALNAGIDFLRNAGQGKELFLGSTLKCFLFPEAEGGALVFLKTIAPDLKSEMRLPENAVAFDLFGNPLPGPLIPIGIVPVWLRFTAGDVEKVLGETDIPGLGSPLTFNLSLSGDNRILINTTNRRNRPIDMEISLSTLPEGWTSRFSKQKFQIPANETVTLKFPFQGIIEPLKKYEFKAGINTVAGYAEHTFMLRSCFVDYSGDLSFDHARWNKLGEANLSYDFSRSGEQWKGTDDLSAHFAAVWNESGLKFAVEIIDDVLVLPPSPYAAWKYDSIQLYFDMKKDIASSVDDVAYTISWIDGKDAVAYLHSAAGSRYIGEENQTTGIDSSVEVKCVRLTDNKLRYEVFFPQEALYEINFIPGNVFGFSMLVNDNDGKGRKTGLTLAPKGEEPHGNPASFITMILRK